MSKEIKVKIEEIFDKFYCVIEDFNKEEIIKEIISLFNKSKTIPPKSAEEIARKYCERHKNNRGVDCTCKDFINAMQEYATTVNQEKGKGVDLEKITKLVDKLLETETAEDLTNWLMEKRKNQEKGEEGLQFKERYFDFAEWLGQNYIRLNKVWVHKFQSQMDKKNWRTTNELFYYYETEIKPINHPDKY